MTPAESRAALVGLTEAAHRELLQAWLLMGSRSAEEVRDFLLDVVPAIAEKYGLAASALATDWYEEVREQAGAAGYFVAEPAPMPGTSRYEALVRWGVDPLFRPEPDLDAAASRVSGGLQKIVTNVHGQTLTESTDRDPAAQGWSRHARSEGCAVCKVLAGRGAVYKASTADFATHDRCRCVAVPEFGAVKEVRDYERSKRFAITEDGERRRREANKALSGFAKDQASESPRPPLPRGLSATAALKAGINSPTGRKRSTPMSDTQQTQGEATAGEQPTNEGEQQTEEKQQQEEQTFTQADVDRIVADRLKRERDKYKDYDDLKAKAGETATVEERMAQLERDLAAERTTALRATVAARFGVSTEPAEDGGPSDAELFLTGSDEESLTAQAKRLAGRESERKTRSNYVPAEGTNPRAAADPKREFLRELSGN